MRALVVVSVAALASLLACEATPTPRTVVAEPRAPEPTLCSVVVTDWSTALALHAKPGGPVYAHAYHADHAYLRAPVPGEPPLLEARIESDGISVTARFDHDDVPLFPTSRLVMKRILKPWMASGVPWTVSKDGGIEVVFPLPAGLTLATPASDLREVVGCNDLTPIQDMVATEETIEAKLDKGVKLAGEKVPLSSEPGGPKLAELTTKDVLAKVAEKDGQTRVAWVVEKTGIIFGWVPSSAVSATSEEVPTLGLVGNMFGGMAGRSGSNHDALVCSHPVTLKVKVGEEVFEVGTVHANQLLDVRQDGTAAPRGSEPGIALEQDVEWIVDAAEIVDCHTKALSSY